jgi:hypothetical protein
MTLSHLLAIWLVVVAGTASFAQSIFGRFVNGFTPIGTGKTEWVDLDNDNDLDILSAGSASVSPITIIYENIGGTMTVRSTNLPAMSEFVTADYDNDGDKDVLAFNYDTQFTKVYRNDGAFTFTETILLSELSATSAAWLDVDNDEDLDVLLIGAFPTAKLFENTGAGFIEIPDVNLPDCTYCDCEVADVDGDGRTDIIFGGLLVALYKNVGDKKFVEDKTVDFKQPFGAVTSGDYDNDGDIDLVLNGMLNHTMYTAIYENENGRLTERIDTGLPPLQTVTHSGLRFLNANNDGKLDLFVAGRSDANEPNYRRVDVFKNSGDSFIESWEPYLSMDGVMGSYDPGDFDNDGDIDLAFVGYYGALEGFPAYFVNKPMSGIYKNSLIETAGTTNTKPQPPSVSTFHETGFRKQIRLYWGDGSDGQTPAPGLFYNFYLRDATKKLIVPNVDFSTGLSRSSNLPNGTGRCGFAFDMPEGTLYYAVQSVDGAKVGSSFSTEKMFYHFNGPETQKVEIVDQQNVTLSWIDHSSMETNFEILRSTLPTSGFTSITTLPANTQLFNNNFSFETEQVYYYRVRGYNAEASLYDSMELVIPNRPTNVVAKAINASKITLTWNDESEYEIAHIIERREGAGTFTPIAFLGANTNQYEDVGLMDGVLYEYRVSAKSENGSLTPVSSASARTNYLPKGVNFEVSAIEDKTLSMTNASFHNNFVDANSADDLTKIKIVSLPENGTLYVYTSKAVVGQEITPDLFNYIEFVPNANYTGTTTFSVLPHDGTDYGVINWTISLNFAQVNDAPLFSLNPIGVIYEDFADPISIENYLQYFPAEDDQIVTYSLSPATADFVDVQFDPSVGRIQLKSKPNMYGSIDFTLTANDGQDKNNTYSKVIKIVVRAVNDVPVFGPIENLQTELASVTVDLDVSDVDEPLTASMFEAYSWNMKVVKSEKISFSASQEGKIQMRIESEPQEGYAWITVVVFDGENSVAREFIFTRILIITGVEDDPMNEIVLFPNPVETKIGIKMRESAEAIRYVLTDVHGRHVHAGIVEDSTIDLSTFAPGTYLVEFFGRDGKITSKKIIKR